MQQEEGIDLLDEKEFFDFCDMTGTPMRHTSLFGEGYKLIIKVIENHSSSLESFLAYYIAFINCQKDNSYKPLKRKDYINLACNLLDDSLLPYEIVEDKEGVYIFPKGVPEFDSALVSEPLHWLKAYPSAEKAWIKALREYAESHEENASDIADKFRKALEAFFQEFFNSDRTLENLKSELYLKYDETFIMSNIIQKDVYKSGEKFADVTIKLSENLRTQRRVYTKFVTILGDVGGFMEVIFTLFRIISSFSVDILYEVSMVNRLFNFDLNKKNVILKEITDVEDDKTVIFGKRRKKGNKDKEKGKDSENEKNPGENDINIIKVRNKGNRKTTKSLTQKKSLYNYNHNDLNSFNLSSSKNKAYIPEVDLDNRKTIIDNSKVESSYDEKRFVKKVRMNRACIYICFCFVRRRKIMENVIQIVQMDILMMIIII